MASSWQRLQEIADAAEPALRRAYLDAIEQIQKATSALRIAAAIERGDIVAVNKILQDAHLERALLKAADVIRQLTRDAARFATIQIAKDTQISGSLRQTNPAAVRAAEQQAARMVTRVSEQTRAAIRAAVADAVRGNQTAQQAARQIRDLIGLTPAQAKAVQNYRVKLEKQGATQAQIDKAVARYTQQLLKQRASTIARTETQAAANAGQQAIWQQARKDGLLPQDVKRRWIVTPDDRLCPRCQALDGQVVGLDDPFVAGTDSVMTPPLHPNCRCAIALDVASLAATRGVRVKVAA